MLLIISHGYIAVWKFRFGHDGALHVSEPEPPPAVSNWLEIAYFCYFLLPLSHTAPSFPTFPLKFRAEVNRQETRVMGVSSSEDRMIVAGVVLAWYQRVTDGRSDGQT